MKRKRRVVLLLSAAMVFTMAAAVLPPDAVKAEATDSVIMYRLYNPNSGEHFYTSDVDEGMRLYLAGWEYEGYGWHAPNISSTPVYRLYNPNAGEHHYTTNVSERNTLVGLGWHDEGIGWYSDDAGTIPIYREYNPNVTTGTHNYTTEKAEHDNLVSVGWRDEGIGWYGVEGEAEPEYHISGQYINGSSLGKDMAVFTVIDDENGVLNVSLAFTDSNYALKPTYATSDMTFDGKNAVGEIDGIPVTLKFLKGFPHPYHETRGFYFKLYFSDPEGHFQALNRNLKEGTEFYNRGFFITNNSVE